MYAISSTTYGKQLLSLLSEDIEHIDMKLNSSMSENMQS